MNKAFPHTIAKHNKKVVGYALSMTSLFEQDIPWQWLMFNKIKKRISPTINYLVMSQICVAKTHRLQGVFRRLYNHLLLFTQNHFDVITIEVDMKNLRSIQAHQAVGFTDLLRY